MQNCVRRCCVWRGMFANVFCPSIRRVHSVTINPENFAVFKSINDSEWMNAKSGSFKPLHALNRLRVPWIVSYLQKSSATLSNEHGMNVLSGMTLLDVGCGSGLLTTALCRLGANVVGLDANQNLIRFAEQVAEKTLHNSRAGRIEFCCLPIEKYAAEHVGEFDSIIASEVLEHVLDVPNFIANCVRLAKPKSHLFFTTINRTLLSRVLAIWMAEDLFSVVPKGVHKWENFLAPAELQSILLENNCRMSRPLGMIYNPLINSWSWNDCALVNYAVVGTRVT